jgi:hypothetical protein
MLKLGLAIILAGFAGGALWVEQGHRVVIDAPTPGQAERPAAAVCPDNDTVPYDARCLDYLSVTTQNGHQRVAALQSPSAPACPDNDRVPYSPNCIAFLKGATETGMRWRATADPLSLPAPQ